MSKNIELLKVYNYSINFKWNNGQKEKLSEQEIYGLDKVLTEVIENFIDDYEYIVNEENYNKYKGE